MIKSMTGYGKGEAADIQGRCVVEVKTVNNRYGEVSVKMPRSFLAYEHEVRKAVGGRVKRGKADLFVQWEAATGEVVVPPLNHAVARGYHQAFLDLAHELHVSAEIPLSLILAQRNVLQESASEEQGDLLPLVLQAVGQALDGLDGMRLREGEALQADLKGRRTDLAALVAQVRERAPQVVDEYQQKLQQRLEKLLGGTELDPQRLAQEVALLADRCDITEELVRLESHFIQFDETLLLKEPVGRKLDFLMQEINREVNTIGSKANDATITSLVVQMKAELEKMREQVQNIE
ncbi:TIGR00255 family protein [Trichlorobacter thiogenes]|uniref:TIGR00255 family protein n=1 Tax=Trichlorobacter thiogenes TaxID=115783 RepID=A0A1T4QUU6_9BACT|nr:YicC/YloC family endoribonuclease [Trichlorobacter thiogenes]SKA07523.1 TIGR00255 family protein [Trichlorobacter thiogenes]